MRYSRIAAVMECSEWTADNAGSSPARCLCTRARGHSLVISAARLLSAYVSVLSKLFQPGTIQQVTDKCPWPLRLALACSHFFYLWTTFLLSVYLYVRLFLCVWLRRITLKLQTMQRALAEETGFCPTPTNRKPLLHPPHPAFVSDTHTRHTQRGSVITLYRTITRLVAQTAASVPFLEFFCGQTNKGLSVHSTFYNYVPVPPLSHFSAASHTHILVHVRWDEVMLLTQRALMGALFLISSADTTMQPAGP